MNVWSPSQTSLWLECPLKWSLRRQEIPEELGTWHPAQLVGTAFHAGLRVYLDPTQPEKSLSSASQDLSQCLLDGWPKGVEREWQLDVVELQALRCLAKVCKDTIPDLLGDNGVVVATECQLGYGDKEGGQYSGTADLITMHGGRRDVGCDRHDGCELGPCKLEEYLVVTDYKSHWTVRSTERYLSETVRSWQLHQYAYFAQIKFDLPVRYIRSVHIQVTPTPKAWVYPVPMTQKRLDMWREHAENIWDEMMAQHPAVGAVAPWPNWSSCEKYGAAYRCGYYGRCHE